MIDQLYRLSDDPLETRNLIRTHPQPAIDLRAGLERWLSRISEGAEAESPEIDDEMRQALEALGYLD